MTLRDFFERYGVTLTIVVALVLVLAILPGNAPDQTVSELGPAGSESDVAGGQDVAGEGGSTAVGSDRGTRAAGGGGGGPGATVSGGGDVADAIVQFGKGDCRPDGREAGISIYKPPCALFKGPNGGATAKGVTGTTITIVRWMGQVDEAVQAILEANKLADNPERRTRSYEALLKYNNQHSVTYGREVVMKTLPASGPSYDDRAMRADGIKIAEDLKAFAVIEGTPDSGIPKVLAKELAQRGVICMCTSTLTSDFYKENPPYIFGTGLPSSTEYAIHMAEFIGKRLAGRNAKWAGDVAYRTQKRKFGLLYVEGSNDRVEPEAKRFKDFFVKELAKYGIKLTAIHAVLFDPGENQNEIGTRIADMRDKGVTTFIGFWDPLSPILITREMTRQRWFPENFVTGSGLSDTTTAGRLYSAEQWRNAFGISPLWVTWESVTRSAGYRQAHHGDPKMEAGDEGVLVNIYAALVGQVFVGIHMAGPKLTADTFAQGMYRFPKTGGTAGGPLVFFTRAFPNAIKDFTEVWFDIDRRGPDERGEQGFGMMMKANLAKRYIPGSWPRTDPSAFIENGKELSVSDNPPGGGILKHEEDGHKHTGDCKTCEGFKTSK
jgi:hypothetical protein